ncbi:hypothetical protein ACFL26_01395 [Patescibacteria group bacterium]
MKPVKPTDKQFSAEDVQKFIRWLAGQPQLVQEVYLKDPSQCVRTMRSLARGVDPNDIGRMRPLYGV